MQKKTVHEFLHGFLHLFLHVFLLHVIGRLGAMSAQHIRRDAVPAPVLGRGRGRARPDHCHHSPSHPRDHAHGALHVGHLHQRGSERRSDRTHFLVWRFTRKNATINLTQEEQ